MARPAETAKTILSLLTKHHLLSAVELSNLLDSAGVAVNKTTVYRALERLLEDGQICRHSLGGDTLVYERKDHHHAHAICDQCGSIEELETVVSEQTAKGFQITHEHRTVFGICQSCQKKTGTSNH